MNVSLLEAIMQGLIISHRDMIQAGTFIDSPDLVMRNFAVSRLYSLGKTLKDQADVLNDLAIQCNTKAAEMELELKGGG